MSRTVRKASLSMRQEQWGEGGIQKTKDGRQSCCPNPNPELPTANAKRRPEQQGNFAIRMIFL
jgi:hypothetical protein